MASHDCVELFTLPTHARSSRLIKEEIGGLVATFVFITLEKIMNLSFDTTHSLSEQGVTPLSKEDTTCIIEDAQTVHYVFAQ